MFVNHCSSADQNIQSIQSIERFHSTPGDLKKPNKTGNYVGETNNILHQHICGPTWRQHICGPTWPKQIFLVHLFEDNTDKFSIDI